MKTADAPLDPARMTALLRDSVLTIGPEDMGLSPTDCPQVWGVMMELGEPEVVVSLAALVDGSVSIYLSDGAGVIGCGLHPDVRMAAAKMLHVAQQVVDFCMPAADHPMPRAHQVCFHLLTSRGVLIGEATRAELDEGETELAELYCAGHGVIGLVELLGAGVDLIDEMHLAQAAQSGMPAVDVQAFKARGRGCRILPYVGNVVRRSRN